MFRAGGHCHHKACAPQFLLGTQGIHQARKEQAALPAQTEQVAARAALQGHRHSQCHSLNVVVFLRDVDILHPGKAFHSAADKLLRVAALGLPQGQHLRPIGRLHQTVHDIGCLLLFQITARARVLTSS